MLVTGSTKRPGSIEDLLSPSLVAQLDRIDVVSRRIFVGKLLGERRSKRRGQSVEFDDHRNYVPGDDLRHIDWNVFARLDRFFIKVFQEEQDLSVHLVVDASASMAAGNPEKLTIALRLAMALGYIALIQNNRVAITVFDGTSMYQLPAMRGRRSVQRLGRFLLGAARPPGPDRDQLMVVPGIPADFTKAMRQAATARTGSGIMIVLSDFLIPGGYNEGLMYLAGAGTGSAGQAGGAVAGASGGRGTFDMYCFQLLSPGELDPAVEEQGEVFAGDLRLTDIETGRAAEVTVSRSLLEKYRRTVREYIDTLAHACRSRDMTHLLVRSDADLQALLIEDFRRRGLLR